MKSSHILLYVIFVFSIIPNLSSSQDIALTDEVYNSNGVIYKNSGTEFTGTLYEYNDFIKNDCSCTMQAQYTNGILNGEKKLWYTNGPIKFSGSYFNGTPDNVHKSYTNSGKLFEEAFYINGKQSWNKNYYESGNIKQLTTYNTKTGKKEKSTSYFDEFNKPIKMEERFENGKFIISKEYYPNSNIKTQKKYILGELTGEITYYENGNIKTEYTYLNNKENTFSSYNEDGKPTKKYKWLSNLDLHENHEYYDNGNLKKHYFNNKNGKLDSVQTTYYQDGLKERETAYLNNRIIREGSFRNDKKQGDWFYYSKDGNTKTTNTYQLDSLINSQSIKYSHLVKNISFNEYDKLFIYKEYDINEEGLIKFTFINNNSLSSTNNSNIASKIKSQLTQGLDQVTNRFKYNEKSIIGFIEVEDLNVKYKSSLYERAGNKETGYDAFITFNMSIYNADHELKHTMSFKENQSDKLLTSLLKTATSSYFKSKQSAFDNSLKHLDISKFIYRYFPIQGLIVKPTDENSKKVKEVLLNIGVTEKVTSGMRFKVMQTETKSIAKLKVISFNNNKAIAEVLEGEKELKLLMQSNQKIKVIQIKK